MATVQRIEHKGGISYKITVSCGRDTSGRQIRHYKTYTPEPNMTERQIKKNVERLAFEFEQQITQGFAIDDRQTFAQYANYVIDLKERNGLKHKTAQSYRRLLERIIPAIGHMKLNDIRPMHLNLFYKNLSESGIRKNSGRAAAKCDIKAMIKEQYGTLKAFRDKTGVAQTTLKTVNSGGNITVENAAMIAKGLSCKVDELFTVTKNDKPLQSKTINEYHRFISSVLAQAEREMIVLYNAASKASPPKIKQNEAKTFQLDEVQKIIDCLPSEPLRTQAMIQLLMVTGCRRGEIAGLKWSKVDWHNRQLKIDCTVLYETDIGLYEDTTKTNNTRFIKLPAQTMETLRMYRQWQIQQQLMLGDKWQNSSFVFTNDFGGMMTPDNINTVVRNFGKKYGIKDMHPHKFRHSMASLLFFNGIDAITISKRLGHAKVSTTTDIYSHIIKQADEAASDCIADNLFKSRIRSS